MPRGHSRNRVFPPQRFVATNDLLVPQFVCMCGMRHREPFAALCCVRRWREQKLRACCVLEGAFAPWPLDQHETVKRYCSSLGLSIEHDIPSLFAEHAQATAQQSLALEPPTLRTGQAWLTKANSYK